MGAFARWAGIGLALGAVACESWVTVEAEVVVPAALVAETSEASPGVLVGYLDIPKTGTFLYPLAVLCGGEEPVETSFGYDHFGCAKEGQVAAWIEPAGEDVPPCGLDEDRGTLAGPDEVPTDLPSARQVVFEGNTGEFGCPSGSEAVSLVLDAPE